MNLTGNTILITGGTGGIGFEFARQFIKRGNKVIVTGRNEAKIAAANAKLPELHVIKSDVSRTSDIESLFTRVTKDFPELNVLVNNAGIWRTRNLQKDNGDLASLTEELDINLAGPIRMVSRFFDQLKSKPSAAIVNVSSGLAFVPLPIAPIYCATKAALHSYTLSLRVQLANTAIKVFEVAPPLTSTDLLEGTNPEDVKGVTAMSVEEMVSTCMEGFERDRFEIRPGQSNQLRFMNRLAPDFILAQLSKPVARMHAGK